MILLQKYHNWNVLEYLTVRLTPESGRSSETAKTNSFPYFEVNKFLICNKSGTSEHLGAANIMLATASRSSVGHSLWPKMLKCVKWHIQNTLLYLPVYKKQHI